MKRFALLLLMMLLVTGCTVQAENTNSFDLSFTERELSGSWDSAAAVSIVGTGASCTITGRGAKLENGRLILSREGVYHLSGKFSGIQILITAGEKDKVQLVLDQADVSCSDGPAILAESADKLFLTIPENTVSTLTDGAARAEAAAESALDGAVFSRTDLCINGKGSLTVTSQYKHGVVSKDDLVITGVELTVNAPSTALDGKDCVMLNGVSAALTAGTNGIRSDNAEDPARGYVYLLDSTLTITASGDGVQAETLLRADNTVMTVTTGDGSESQQTTANTLEPPGRGFGGFGGFGGWGTWGDQSIEEAADDESWKGLKSAGSMVLNGGAFVIDSADDCLHANGDLTITDGRFTLSSGDDGIHADGHLLISGGDIRISRSFEGLEASKLEITGGSIDIVASDDGLNAAGGADGSASADRWGRGSFSSMSGEIIISGGYIHINAAGDGIDSNNTILVSGGVTLVSGSANSANAAFDYDGEATVTGGILFAAGGSGMAQSFTAAENQGCILFGINGSKAGVNIAIVNSENQVVAAYTPENSYSAVVVTAPGLQVGSTYAVVMNASIEGMDAHGFAANAAYTGGTSIGSIEMTTLLQGGSGHSMGGGPGGGFGGGPGGGGRRPGR